MFEARSSTVKAAKYAAAKAAFESLMELNYAPESKNPLFLIHKIWPGIDFVCVSNNGEPDARFTMSVTINGQTFEGTGEFLHLKDERLL
jgi:hypothetical protein